MKTKLIWILMPLCLVFQACDRYSYREDYVGDFAIHTRRTVTNAAVPDTTETDYNGYVREYGLDEILIRFLADDSIPLQLEKDGTFDIVALKNGSTFAGGYSDVNNWTFESTFTVFNGDHIWLKATGTR